MIATCIGALSLAVWLYLFAARGRFWRVSTVEAGLKAQAPAPRIAVVIPARNEADVILPVIRSLLGQDYAGPLRIFVVDDHSSDQTAAIVRDVETDHSDRLSLVRSDPLPAGWTGKMWALSQGTQSAAEFSPDYFLFTDADIIHAGDSISTLVSLAQSDDLDLVSMMAKLRCSSFAERALIPAFVYFFFMLYPPKWVNNPTDNTAAAAGGDILVRTGALERIGGIAAIRHELIDDCALAREIKRKGKIRLGLTNQVMSIREYGTFASIGRMISRNAFYQLRHLVWLLLGTLVAMAVTFIAPPILIFFSSWARLLGGLAWLIMTITFLPM